MSLLESLSQKSLFSDRSLLQDREGYSPLPQGMTPEVAFLHWTRRATVQSEQSLARELAGLSDQDLAGLEGVFAQSPLRRRADALRFAMPVGGVLLFLGAIALLLLAAVPLSGSAVGPVVQALGIGTLVAGLLGVAVGALTAFNMMPMDVAHGRVGLIVGLLNDQHPWLYKASQLAHTPAADAYRQGVLTERGALRGVDYLMMREIARAHEALALTQVARSVTEELQAAAALPEPPTPKEPRLVAVPALAEAGASNDRADTNQAVGLRSFK